MVEKNWIKNFDKLATTPERKLVLEIAEAGYDAINTEKVILDSIKLENNILKIKDQVFDLAKFKRIKVVGFGKCACDAALALEKVLGSKIEEGVVIGLKKVTCEYIESFAGTHPLPSPINIEAGKKIYEIVDKSNEDDLIIAIVSGGGSALLCYPESECAQGIEVYEKSIKHNETIVQMNTIRKHLSLLKGGGLAKIAFPATVIGLIFSDVPGDRFDEVASGPTYLDETTIDTAQKIIDQYDLGKFDLIETPKEDKYFERVHNIVLVSNKTAVEAMAEKIKSLNMPVLILGTELYEEVNDEVEKIFKAQNGPGFILAAGEPKLEVTKKGGSGGRSLYTGLSAINMGVINDKTVFVPLASDGMDNSDAAGAVVDINTVNKLKELKINVADALSNFDAYPAFKQSGDMIMTGPTGANVSDLMILYINK